MHCLVVTNDFSRLSLVFFLATKDETNEILKTFIAGIENLIDLRVKVIRYDNGNEFKNRVMNQFCEMKGIEREFSVARTPQQNGVAERKNMTPIEEEEEKDAKDPKNEDNEVLSTEEQRVNQENDENVNSTNNINTVSRIDNVVGIEDNVVDENIVYGCADDPNIPDLEEIGRFGDAEDDDSGADINNLDTYFQVFAPVARVEAIRLLLAYASFKDFVLYHMDVKSAFLYDEFYGRAHIFLRTASEAEGRWDFRSQDKYEILNKFGFSDVKTTSTPMETHKTLLKDEKGEDVDEHLYRSMIESLMYLTSSRPDIMFALKVNVVRHELTTAGDDSVKKKTVNGEEQLKDLMDRKKVSITKATIRRDLQLKDAEGVDCLPNAEIFETLTLIRKRFSGRETPLFPTMMVQDQEDMGEEDEAFNEENVSKHSNDPLRSGEDRIQLKALMEICTNLHNRVFDLENTRTAQAQEIDSLKKIVKKLKRRHKSKTHRLKRLYKVGLPVRVEYFDEESLGEEDASKQGMNIADIDADKEITLVDETIEDQGRFDDQEMFDTRVLDDEEVVEKVVADKEISVVEEVNDGSITTPINAAATTTTAVATPTISMDEIILAKALIEIKTSRPKTKGIVMQEPSEKSTPTPIVSSQQSSKVHYKSKEIMVEEPLKMKKNDQISFDKQEAQRLQAEFDEEERLAREKNEANNAVIEQWHDKRMKFFVAKRAEEKRNKPPTKAQQRNIMCTYLKNMDRWKPKNLKNKSFADIQDLFKKAMKMVNMFVDMDTKMVKNSKKTKEIAQEGSSKREGDELEQDIAKKQRIKDKNESAELKRCLEIVSDDGDDVTIYATPLSSKTPTIVDYKIYK
nr:putative ribonuclease H-like domain-containing protein [Tanacetum cinerariifolium]